MEELIADIASLKATLHAHVAQEDRDRKEELAIRQKHSDCLMSIKNEVSALRTEFATWKGGGWLALKLLAGIGVVIGIIVTWWKQ